MTGSLAMHMANELLSMPVAAATLAAAAGVLAVSGLRARRSLDLEKLPLMGVLGAFVFAAQMINFALPGGLSGHLGGGVLLAILLGPAAAILTIASILIVQCLIFQDGGLLALGCNIINIGVLPALLGWGLYRLVLGPVARASAWRQYVATWAACTVGVAGGAALVPLEARLSNVLLIPLGDFLAVMVGVHLAIGFVEGAITFAVVAYLRRARPQCLGLEGLDESRNGRVSRRAVAVTLLATAGLLAGVVSWFASAHPDGLEYSYLEHKYAGAEKVVRDAEPGSAVAAVTQWQERTAPLPDYSVRPGEASGSDAAGQSGEAQAEADGAWPNVDGWGSLAGLLGTVVTLGLLYGLSRILGRRRPVADQP